MFVDSEAMSDEQLVALDEGFQRIYKEVDFSQEDRGVTLENCRDVLGVLEPFMVVDVESALPGTLEMVINRNDDHKFGISEGAPEILYHIVEGAVDFIEEHGQYEDPATCEAFAIMNNLARKTKNLMPPTSE